MTDHRQLYLDLIDKTSGLLKPRELEGLSYGGISQIIEETLRGEDQFNRKKGESHSERLIRLRTEDFASLEEQKYNFDHEFYKIYRKNVNLEYLQHLREKDVNYLLQIVAFQWYSPNERCIDHSIKVMEKDGDGLLNLYNEYGIENDRSGVIKRVLDLLLNHCYSTGRYPKNLKKEFWRDYITIVPKVAISALFKVSFDSGISALDELLERLPESKFRSIFQYVFQSVWRSYDEGPTTEKIKEGFYKINPLIVSKFLYQFKLKGVDFKIPDIEKTALVGFQSLGIDDIPVETFNGENENTLKLKMLKADVFDHKALEFAKEKGILKLFNIDINFVHTESYDPSELSILNKEGEEVDEFHTATLQPIQNLNDINLDKVDFKRLEYIAPLNIYKGYEIIGPPNESISPVDPGDITSAKKFLRYLLNTNDDKERTIISYDVSASDYFKDVIIPFAKSLGVDKNVVIKHDTEKSHFITLESLLKNKGGSQNQFAIATGTLSAMARSNGMKSYLSFDTIINMKTTYGLKISKRGNDIKLKKYYLYTGLAVEKIKDDDKIKLARCVLFTANYIKNYISDFTAFLKKDWIRLCQKDVGYGLVKEDIEKSVRAAYEFLSFEDIINKIGFRKKRGDDWPQDDYEFKSFFNTNFIIGYKKYLKSNDVYEKKVKELSGLVQSSGRPPSKTFHDKMNKELNELRIHLSICDFDMASNQLIALNRCFEKEINSQK